MRNPPQCHWGGGKGGKGRGKKDRRRERERERVYIRLGTCKNGTSLLLYEQNISLHLEVDLECANVQANNRLIRGTSQTAK